MSIAEEETKIDESIELSKNRLVKVQQKLQQLNNEKKSVEEDICKLSERAKNIRSGLKNKWKAYESLAQLHTQSQDASRKLKESIKMLLYTVKSESKSADDILNRSYDSDESEENEVKQAKN